MQVEMGEGEPGCSAVVGYLVTVIIHLTCAVKNLTVHVQVYRSCGPVIVKI